MGRRIGICAKSPSVSTDGPERAMSIYRVLVCCWTCESMRGRGHVAAGGIKNKHCSWWDRRCTFQSDVPPSCTDEAWGDGLLDFLPHPTLFLGASASHMYAELAYCFP